MLRRLPAYLNRLLLLVSGLALFTLMVLTFTDVLGRKFFQPITGALEVSEMLMVILLFTALPVVSWRGDHVGLDLVDHFYRGWLDRLTRSLADWVSGVALGLLGQACFVLAARTLGDGDVSSHLRIPIGWFIYLMAFMLMLTAVLSIVRGAIVLLKGPQAMKPLLSSQESSLLDLANRGD
tara:strand:- start:10748 stop:11287 length:540 start_codon:yes stop_codon:yes gene_type:complete